MCGIRGLCVHHPIHALFSGYGTLEEDSMDLSYSLNSEKHHG